MDLLTAYRRSLFGFTQRVAQVRPHQWSVPTPCVEWDVRALVNHLVGENLRTVPLLEGATPEEAGDGLTGDLLGDDPAAVATTAATAAAAAVAAPGAMKRTVRLSSGDVPATEYVYRLLADHLVHAWDLAVAVGVDPRLDPDAVRLCAGWFTDREDVYRAGRAIGPRVPVPVTADPQDRLLGAFGRNPNWSP
mgnify:CR=1 FL=1